MAERDDVGASLTAMDDKLRELQRELSVLTIAPEPGVGQAEAGEPREPRARGAAEPEGADAAEAEGAPRPAPEPIEAPEPEQVTARALRARPISERAELALATAAAERAELPLAAAAADQARAIIAEAQAEATRIVGEAAHRVTALAAQIDDLERLRGELERSARALVDDYAAALAHVERTPSAGPVPPTEPPPSAVHPPLW